MKRLLVYGLLFSVLYVATDSAFAASSKTKAKHSKKKKKISAKRRPAPISIKQRQAGLAFVSEQMASPAEPFDSGALLVDFFEQLYRQHQGNAEEPMRILQYGDSHTAADVWTGNLRTHFQADFGNGGAGFSHAGHPFLGYRRVDVKGTATRRWTTTGLVGRPGDGLSGLSGISIFTSFPQESISLDATAERLKIFYLQQPGGGAFQVYDGGTLLDAVSTDGTLGPGIYNRSLTPGAHHLELQTVGVLPVRLFGWVTEEGKGVTYETMGINGAQISAINSWNPELLGGYLKDRNPALIVVAYGTNEARRKDLTYTGYRNEFAEAIRKFRKFAPTASILIVGPPDSWMRVKRRMAIVDRVDTVRSAQRSVAQELGCAFWDWRERMGGKGSMRKWVWAGLAQPDYVHFTAAGYHQVGDALFADVMEQYQHFIRTREETLPAATIPASLTIPVQAK